MAQALSYDAIIIGAGQAGGPLSTTLANTGWKTALIEREHVGGTCINEGCTPTKTMVASARVAYLARRAADYGVQTGPVSVDMMVVRQRKRAIVQSFRSGSERRIESTDGVDLLRGEASFTSQKTLNLRLNSGEVRQLSAEVIIINSGARPSTLSLSGIERVQKQVAEGRIQLRVHTPQGERTLNGSHLLVAAGRIPNSDSLNLAAAGVQVDRRGFIPVNGHLETNVAGIYALGDIKGGPAFTHISYDDFRILRSNLLEGGRASVDGRLVPYTVFIDPQLGRVGLSESEAHAQGRNVRIAKMPMSYVARALEVDETRGFMKAIVDAESAQILGCAVLGLEGGEIMSILQVAMLGKLPYTALRDGVFAHPTLAESLNNLFSMLDE